MLYPVLGRNLFFVMVKSLIKALHQLAKPLYRRFYSILFFILILGLVDGLWFLASCFFVEGLNAIHDEVFQQTLVNAVRHSFIWFLAAYILTAIMMKWNRWWVKAPIYAITFIFCAVQFFLVDNFKWPISPSYLMLAAETNSNEAGEFFNNYVFSRGGVKTLLWCIAYVALFFFLRFLWRKVLKRASRLANPGKKAIKTILGIVLIPTLAYGVNLCQVFLDMAQCKSIEKLRRIVKPKDPFTNTYCSCLILGLVEESMSHAQEVTLRAMDASLTADTDDSLNVVLVIGESYIKCHAQIYGYPLNTTPCMMREKDAGRLLAFNDVVTTHNLTSNVLKNMLSTNCLSQGESWYDTPYFPAIFRGAGYHVYFWDNQKESNVHAEYNFALNSFLYCKAFEEKVYEAVNKNNSITFDGEIVKMYADSVRLKPTRNFVIFHLMGQHFIASNRFPQTKEYIHFTKDSIKSSLPYLTPAKKQSIADYDNATRYNDEVVGQIFQLFASSNSIVIYLSDHGEELYDYRDRTGRDHGPMSVEKAKAEYEVPFVVWFSDVFKEKHPDLFAAFESSVDKPFMIDDLCNLLFHVGGVVTSFYRPEHDVLSPDYQCKSRLLEGYWDYDKKVKGKNK